MTWGACVMFNEILNRTNEAGRVFAQNWLQGRTLLGVEPTHDSRKQFFVVYVNGEGHRAVLCLPDAGTGCAPCYFGSLEYYADAVARAFVRSYGVENYIGLRYLPDDQKRGAAVAKYNEIINKYKI